MTLLHLYTQLRQLWNEHFSSAWAREQTREMNEALIQWQERRRAFEQIRAIVKKERGRA